MFSTMHEAYSTSDPPTPSDSMPAICPSKFPPLTQDNCADLGPSLVLTAIQSINASGRVGRDEQGWCVDRVWLELQLVLDEWGSVDPNAWFQGARILLAHFAKNSNWTLNPVFSRLLRRMGAEFQVLPKNLPHLPLLPSHIYCRAM